MSDLNVKFKKTFFFFGFTRPPPFLPRLPMRNTSPPNLFFHSRAVLSRSYSRISRTALFRSLVASALTMVRRARTFCPCSANNLTQIAFCCSDFEHGDLLSHYLGHLYLTGLLRKNTSNNLNEFLDLNVLHRSFRST
jgi:hypothetical protein